jgi:hypothetical protein
MRALRGSARQTARGVVACAGAVAAFAIAATLVLWPVAAARAATPVDVLARYEALAREADPAFAGFSTERGRAFYFERHPLRGLGDVSCASCHLDDPRQGFRAHRAPVLCRSCHVINDAEHVDPANAKRREMPPFAPVGNPQRLTDFDRAERWFDLNCRLLLKRPCTVTEKGDFVAWLVSLR